MRRQMLVINVLMLVAAVGLAAKLRADWRRANQRYQVLSAPLPAPAPGPRPPAPSLGAGDLDVIVQRNLFSPDRNSDPPQAAEKKPPPPEPILVGTLNLGRGKLALLAEPNTQGGSIMPRQVREGEDFAGYKLVSIGDNQVVMEYEGQQKKVELSIAVRQVAAPVGVTAPAAPAQAVTTITSAPAPAPSSSQVGSIPAPGSGPVGPTGRLIPGTNNMYGHSDNLPAGAVVGDRRKVVRRSPFGDEVWWEPVKPEERKP